MAVLSGWLCLMAGVESFPAEPAAHPEPFRIEIGVKYGVQPGQKATIPVHLLSGADRIDGFMFLVAFDSTVMKFQGVKPGDWTTGPGWRDFDYRLILQSERESIYPLCLMQISARRESPVGSDVPAADSAVDLAELTFSLIDDPKIACRLFPLQFFWRRCDDNVIYESPGRAPRYVRRVYEQTRPSARVDEFDADTLPAVIRDLPPPCAEWAESMRDFTVNFVNGGIVASCVRGDPLDRPMAGDLDENGLPDRMEDLGILADLILREGVENASRSNIYGGTLSHAPDGTPLTLGSLVRLANPLPFDSLINLPPRGDIVLLNLHPQPDTLKIFCQSTVPLGGLLMVFDVAGETSPPLPTRAIANMMTRSLAGAGTFRLIMFAHDGILLPAGIHLVAEVPYAGTVHLRSAAAVDRFGLPVKIIFLGH